MQIRKHFRQCKHPLKKKNTKLSWKATYHGYTLLGQCYTTFYRYLTNEIRVKIYSKNAAINAEKVL